MDYFGILKKAWNITWRYRILWVLGLFAGVSTGGSGSSGSNYRTSSSDFSSTSLDPFTRWMSDNWLAFAVVVGVLAMIGFVFAVLSIAAQGGLVFGANEAAEGRAPSLGASWGVGFRKWGRTFMTGFVLGLPVVVVVAVLVGIIVVLIAGGAASGKDAAAAAIAGGVCVILPILLVLVVFLSIVLGIVYPLALRYGVLQDVTFGRAIRRSWDDLWGKRGAFVFWLVMFLPGIAYGFLIIIPIAVLAVPAGVMIAARQYAMAVVFGVVLFLVMMLPAAIYATFVSSAWTIFFRQMTGMEPRTMTQSTYPPAVYQPPAAYPPAAPPAYQPPAPPTYAPPAPQASPVPPASPVAPPSEQPPPGDA